MKIKKIVSIICASAILGCAFAQDFVSEFNSKMVLLPAAEFEMGSEGYESNETPIHTVQLNSFYILSTEVSQKMYKTVVPHNFSNNKGDLLPVEEVSWYDAVIFCNKLSVMAGYTPCYSLNGNTNVDEWGEVPRIDSTEEEKLLWNSIVCDFTANGYRLPTEAEWEYAASDEAILADCAWFKENSEELTHEVATKSPNVNSLYDMNGNVWEWCQDWYGWYKTADGVNDVDGTGRKIRRGGSILSDAVFCRKSNRASSVPELRGIDLGFRVVRIAAEELVKKFEPLEDFETVESDIEEIETDVVDIK